MFVEILGLGYVNLHPYLVIAGITELFVYIFPIEICSYQLDVMYYLVFPN